MMKSDKVIIPQALHGEMLKAIQESGHFGIETCKLRAKDAGMSNYIIIFVKTQYMSHTQELPIEGNSPPTRAMANPRDGYVHMTWTF